MSGAHSPAASNDPVGRAIARAHGILPDQGPIGVFIHHNTLHAFQHLPFHEGVQAGAWQLGAKPYLTLEQFREAHRAGRIEECDIGEALDDALGADAGTMLPLGASRRALWRTLLADDVDIDDVHGLRYRLRHGPAIVDADPALWEAAMSRVARGPRLAPPDDRVIRRHRDVLVACGAADPDVPVHYELTLLCSGFLDQGQSQVPLPGRGQGFLRAVAGLFAAGAHAPRLCRGAEQEFRRIAIEGTPPLAVIGAALDALGVQGDAREDHLLATALALPGWAGMFARLERHPGEHHGDGPVTLTEFLAVRLVLERYAVARTAADASLPVSWEALCAQLPPLPERPAELDALLLWGIARAGGATPAAVEALGDAELDELWREVAACTRVQRRAVWFEAFEGWYRRSVLGALARRRHLPELPATERPKAQFVFCIDEREESIRRAVEEQDPAYETFGVAGFFGMAIDFFGLYDHEPAAHAPVVVIPAHEVHEQPLYTARRWHAVRSSIRARWHWAERALGAWSRTLTGGAGISLLLGPFAAAAAVSRIVAPRSTLALREQVKRKLVPRPDTRLGGIRAEASSAPSARGKLVGFSLQEAVDRVMGVLRSIGLVADFAPVVVILGHGSSSLNNPHESAHDCGACGGRRGGANARLFADLANRPEVREGVRAQGITIPSDTWFVGAMHDTADDAVHLFDLMTLPPEFASRFEEAHQVLERARRHSALERARRFDDAPLGLSPEDALRHVQARASHLAQPRPEYGHCTNAIAFVGRRSMTRGLHFDRRAFLISYDPNTDTDDAVLERILAAVGPVGAGISLEYYFSSVDNEVFGCGTKLPHNVTGLIGVMNGHQGDLRTGLPLQMHCCAWPGGSPRCSNSWRTSGCNWCRSIRSPGPCTGSTGGRSCRASRPRFRSRSSCGRPTGMPGPATMFRPRSCWRGFGGRSPSGSASSDSRPDPADRAAGGDRRADSRVDDRRPRDHRERQEAG